MPELTRRHLLTAAGVAAAAVAVPGLAVAGAGVRAGRVWDFDPSRHRLAVFALGARAITGVGRAAEQPGFPVEHPVAVASHSSDLPGDPVWRWGHIFFKNSAAIPTETIELRFLIKKAQPWDAIASAACTMQAELEYGWHSILDHVDRALIAVDPDGYETLGAAEAVVRSFAHRAVPVLCLAGPARGDLARGRHDRMQPPERLHAAGARLRFAGSGDGRAAEENWAAAVRRCTGARRCSSPHLGLSVRPC